MVYDVDTTANRHFKAKMENLNSAELALLTSLNEREQESLLILVDTCRDWTVRYKAGEQLPTYALQVVAQRYLHMCEKSIPALILSERGR